MKQAVRAIVTKGNTMLVMKRNKFGSEYFTLVGGGIDMGEGPEDALRRELAEEASITVGRIQLVFIEDAGEPYGEQLVYWCEYLEGDPKLNQNSEEAKISAHGKNTYEPLWLPIASLPQTLLRSCSLKDALIEAFQHGYPVSPRNLTWKSEHESRASYDLKANELDV